MTQQIFCRFCDGKRPVCDETNRCRGCGMEVAESVRLVEPPGKRKCPVCNCKHVMWVQSFQSLKCVQCKLVFEPVREGVV